MTKIHELHFQLVDHALYYPDLAPSGFFLFPNSKIYLLIRKGMFIKKVIAYVKAYLAEKGRNYYLEGLKKSIPEKRMDLIKKNFEKIPCLVVRKLLRRINKSCNKISNIIKIIFCHC